MLQKHISCMTASIDIKHYNICISRHKMNMNYIYFISITHGMPLLTCCTCVIYNRSIYNTSINYLPVNKNEIHCKSSIYITHLWHASVDILHMCMCGIRNPHMHKVRWNQKKKKIANRLFINVWLQCVLLTAICICFTFCQTYGIISKL